MLISSVSGTRCSDVRQEQCHAKYKHGQCAGSLDGLHRKNLCCCSRAGKAWGSSGCDQCPRPGTPAFREMCPRGEGFLDHKDINECAEFPGLCGNGRCRNTMGGFDCSCAKGYALDESKTRCIGGLFSHPVLFCIPFHSVPFFFYNRYRRVYDYSGGLWERKLPKRPGRLRVRLPARV